MSKKHKQLGVVVNLTGALTAVKCGCKHNSEVEILDSDDSSHLCRLLGKTETFFLPKHCVRLLRGNGKRPHYDLILEWANGADIEYFSKTDLEWHWVKHPSFYAKDEYRVKKSRAEKIKEEIKKLEEELRGIESHEE
jgi:hypothetical protein